MSEQPSRLRTASPMEEALLTLLYIWVALTCGLALWLFSPVSPRWAALGPLLVFAVLFAWAYAGKPALEEIHTAMDMRQKLGLFAITMAFLFLPKLFDFRADRLLSLAALNIPLVAMACRRLHYQRIYCLNLALTVLIVRRAPGFPAALLGVEALLICACFAADHMAFRTEGYPGGGTGGIRLAVYSTLCFMAAAIGALAICWAILPPLRPRWFEFWPLLSDRWLAPPPRPVERTVNPRVLFLYYGVLVATTAAAYIMMRWALRRLARRKSASIQFGEDEWVQVRKTPRPGRGRRPLFDFSTPKGRIVYAYYLFLRRLADKGLVKPPGDTPAEFAAELQAGSSMPNEAVAEATEVFQSAHYGQGEFSAAEAEAYREKLDRLAEDAEPYSAEGAADAAIRRLPKRRLEGN